MKDLRYGDVFYLIATLVFALLFTIAVLGITFRYLIFTTYNVFQMWPQWPEATETPAFILKQLQEMLFKALPTFCLGLTGLWWAWIDQYYRRTQPYVALARGDVGQKTVLLDYIHDYHFLITWKAIRNRHWQLGYVTAVTTILKVATIGAAGIFVSTYQPSRFSRPMDYLQTWREDVFLENRTQAFGITARNLALSRAFFGYPSGSGWQSGNTLFQGVALNNSDFDNQPGLTSELNCTSVPTLSKEIGGQSGWSASIQEGVCSGASWIGACALPDILTTDNSSNVLVIPGGQCMAWKYLNRSNCPGLESNDTGRWWIYGRNGSLQTSSSGTNQSILEESTGISLLCTPMFYMDYAALGFSGIGAKEGGETTIRERRNRTTLSYDHWKSLSGQDFGSYAFEMMNDTMTSEMRAVTRWTYLDYLSIITALSLDRSTDSLFDVNNLARGANISFGSIFSIMAGLGQEGTDSRSTFLLEATADQGRAPPTTKANRWQYIATLQKIPLIFGFCTMLLAGASILVIWPSHKRRTPLDVAYPANVVSMLYDSSIMDLVKDGPDEKCDFPELRKMRFKIGRFQGLSGRTRIGIDVSDKVEEIKK
jgi:hypothetical protein